MTPQTQKLRDRVLLGLLIFYALSTLISMATMSLGLGALALAFILMPKKRERIKGVWLDPSTRGYTVVSGAILLSAALSLASARIWPLPAQVTEPLPAALAEFRKLFYLAVPLVFAWIGPRINDEGRRKFITLFWGALAILGVIGIQQHFTGWPRREGITIQGSAQRYASVLFMGLSLSVASVLSLVLFPVLFRALDVVRALRSTMASRSPIDCAPFLIFTAIGVASTIFLTFSRMAWIGLTVGLLIALVFHYQKRAIPLLLLGGFGLGVTFMTMPLFKERLTYSGGYADRLALWEGHLELFRQRPVAGVGWRQNGKVVEQALVEKRRREGKTIEPGFFASHAHNLLIDTLASVGLLGLLAFVAWNAWFVRFAWRETRSRGEWSFFYRGAIVGWIVLQINGLTQVNFWDSKVYHQVLLLVGTCFLFRAKSSGDGEIRRELGQA